MAPENSQNRGQRRSMLGVAAYLLVPGERRRRAAGHFERAALEAARGARALYVPRESDTTRSRGDSETRRDGPGDERRERGAGRQRIRID